MKLKNGIKLAVVAACCAPAFAFATNGYFAHGYGMKAKGMAGVGIALPQDAMAAATNPAGMVWVGNRIDFGADLFKPVRTTTLTAAEFGPFAGDYAGNGDSMFLIPEFGYNMMLGSNSSVGVSVYGNGGMNTSYEDFNARTAGAGGMFGFPANGVFGAGKLGVDLMQLFIAPTYAIKVTPDHSLGVSLNLVYQRFKAYGLQNFVVFSNAPDAVSNNGYDSSTGAGLKFGWTGKISPDVTMGATYQTKTKMGKFDKYRGLFAEQGGFDIPETYGIGIAVKASPAVTIAADIQQINYSKIKSVGNSVNNLFIDGNPMGADNGPGFGWKDMTVFKLGADYKYSQNLVLRGGLSTTRQPIPSGETFFNILAPATVENHLTLGSTWTLADKSELTVGYMHAFSKSVTGTGNGAGVNIKMNQNSIGIAYGWKM